MTIEHSSKENGNIAALVRELVAIAYEDGYGEAPLCDADLNAKTLIARDKLLAVIADLEREKAQLDEENKRLIIECNNHAERIDDLLEQRAALEREKTELRDLRSVSDGHIRNYVEKIAQLERAANEPRDHYSDGLLWSFFRSLLQQGQDIEIDYKNGIYKSYAEYAARLDAAARERMQQFKRKSYETLEQPHADGELVQTITATSSSKNCS